MFRRKYSDGARASLSFGSMASIRASMNGSISLQRDDQAQPGMTVEHAGGDHPQHVQARC